MVDVGIFTASPLSIVIEVMQSAPKAQEKQVLQDAERDDDYQRALRLLKLRAMGDGDLTQSPDYFRNSCHLFPVRGAKPGIYGWPRRPPPLPPRLCACHGDTWVDRDVEAARGEANNRGS